jgi:hypothetical protein
VLYASIHLQANCPDTNKKIIWKSHNPLISFYDLAAHASPMLWFSPDEELLYNASGLKQLPNAFPFEKSDGPVVYYKLKTIYTNKKNAVQNNSDSKDFHLLDLRLVTAIDLEFFYYFETETGLGSHPHDIESIILQLNVIHVVACSEFRYAIEVKKLTARAHGLHWYDNVLNTDNYTFFPLSILIEEGKHASCADKNADGQYTPGYDVNRAINDAWGVRDIISSGKLVTGGYQAWMSKQRRPDSILFPPLPETSPHKAKLLEKFGEIQPANVYTLRPYPEYPIANIDKNLDHLMKSKKPHDWPNEDKVRGDGSIKQWVKQEKAFRSLNVANRWDDSNGLSFGIPLLIFKSVEAPMTGGWFFHKLSFGDTDSVLSDSLFRFEKLIGHEIVHTSSASKWIDTYIGLGYEVYDVNFDRIEVDYKTYFVSEAGLKFRVNVSKTPLKFLKYLGTDFWGLRLGWKHVGFDPFIYNGFVIEFGAGAF